VQGVGFRPFVYNLARNLGLGGWVQNSVRGVSIEIEGECDRTRVFLEELQNNPPTHARLEKLEITELKTLGDNIFQILPSQTCNLNKSVPILPDSATCPQCLQEIRDPQNRRYRYPFNNCTHCGPRFSIIESLPYDRPHTTMRHFTMCPECLKEYQDPQNRRFHAQPNACHRCGPHLEVWNLQGETLSKGWEALLLTAAAIREGKIVALKGLGGFHLVVDARNQAAVERLRERKRRPDKPLALMYPSLDTVEGDCFVSLQERQLLLSPEAPIVLLKSRNNKICAPGIAPNNPYLGVMLPSTPLHHLLLEELGFPIVATSGNLANEPICIDEVEALQRLGGIADLFTIHNRAISRPIDDSILRAIDGQPSVLRRARGYISHFRLPKIFNLQERKIPTILALGGHFKNTIALSIDDCIILSQHLGDLDRPETIARFRETIEYLLNIYEIEPSAIAGDLHPDYYSTQFAHQFAQKIPVIPIQHHHAHILSCMAEHQLQPPVLGIAWDGTGWGLDGTIWGGEFLQIEENFSFNRLAHLRQFHLLGGERAVKEPRRLGLAVLYQCFGDAVWQMKELPCVQACSQEELKIFSTMLAKNVRVPLTSSMGRLFDAIASILGLAERISFEGQAAMALEFAIGDLNSEEIYPYELVESESGSTILDWKPIVLAIVRDWQNGWERGAIALKFHNTLVDAIVTIAQKCAIETIVFSGGCFQNRYLLEKALAFLHREGFTPFWQQQIPTNDGGIAIGQILGAIQLLI
jgi:hydrogenase maturation protein HypF